MKYFFDLNHPLWRLMALLTDFLFLTLLWFVFSIPILTIGPATFAVYEMMERVIKKEGTSIISGFWSCFKEDFLMRLSVGLGTMSIFFVFTFACWFYYAVNSRIALFLFFILLLLFAFFIGFLIFLFPLWILKRNWHLKELLKLTFFLELRFFAWSFLLIFINCGLIFLTIFLLPYLTFFLVGALCYLNLSVTEHLLGSIKLRSLG